MKLIVKRIEAPTVPGGYAYALCDESGEMLPMQTECIVTTGVDRCEVTASFKVDGEDLRLEG